MENLNVIIVGAGPAGLTLGLSLQEKNINYTIVEGATKDKLCSDVGGGYDLGSNAIKIYRQFGLGEKVKDRGAHFDKIKSFNRNGKLVNELFLPKEIEMSSVRRSTLQNIILEKIPKEKMILGSKITNASEDGNGVKVLLENGKVVSGDILIAADGVHSVVRKSIFGDGSATHVGVNCMWGRLDWEAVPATSKNKFEGAAMMLGDGQSFIAGQIDGQMMWTTFWNAQAFVRSDNKEEAKKKVMSRLYSWNKDIAEIVKLSNIDNLSEVGIYDRPPAETWHTQRTILIGDAAHPMTPFLGAGANTAIADAFILGHLIENSPSIKNVFENFEKRRKTPLENTVKTARTVCEYSLSKTKWKTWLMLNGMALIPGFLLRRLILSGDNVNDVSDIAS